MAPLNRLRLKNIRCFRDVSLPLDDRLTVIVGGNGTGKTTIMEALASLASGSLAKRGDTKERSSAVLIFAVAFFIRYTGYLADEGMCRSARDGGAPCKGSF